MARERSPNYPGIDLGAAIDAVKQLYDKERRSAVPRAVIAKAWGYNSLSGPPLSRIGALRQYGLIEKISGGKLKVSDRALDFILHSSDSPQYAQAARQAALSPELFQGLYKDYPEASEDALKAHLIKDRSFSEEGANRVIKAFRGTVIFAKLDSESYNEGIGSAGDGDEKAVPEPPVSALRGAGKRSREVGSVSYSWPLGDGKSVELIFTGEPTQRNIDVLLAQLKITREIAPTTTSTAPPEEQDSA